MNACQENKQWEMPYDSIEAAYEALHWRPRPGRNIGAELLIDEDDLK